MWSVIELLSVVHVLNFGLSLVIGIGVWSVTCGLSLVNIGVWSVKLGCTSVFFLENSPRGGKMEILGFEGGQSELGV